MQELDKLRLELDVIDEQIVTLFEQRMAISTRMGVLKNEGGIQVWNEAREAAKVRNREKMLRDRSLTAYVDKLFETILELSRQRQEEQQDR
ncbi:chorismate mutase [Oscillibacter hominis]|uniref:Chorismate mutase n=1 Tax=Oscillibacter hominis TaxID=2763056 RepID=A0A7G9B225_9FIRM|nr:chorismate mutase [Oscillibacter hominis]QNL43606.1 chorismate mutase [Oscillibacter hominis]